MPFKYRHVTPHKQEQVSESPPRYLRILKRIIDDKQQKKTVVRIKKSTDAGKISTKTSNATAVEISPLGPRFSECFSEVFKLESKLMEVDTASILFSSKKYL